MRNKAVFEINDSSFKNIHTKGSGAVIKMQDNWPDKRSKVARSGFMNNSAEKGGVFYLS